MVTHSLRLTKHMDLKEKLVEFTKENNISAGIILTCVGCIYKGTIRLADGVSTKAFDEKLEILSLSGTLSKDGVHLHISLSTKDGMVFGGHLMDGCLINTTAEIVIGSLPDTIFSREFDSSTGYTELLISKI
ncbi:PPC domain-containing DNA-binding protein [Anaeromicrobium sediminis]|uniref:DNA-binding protein n=1 Tax=Anaeromicrobium sediminis TaxID=1478221 RepID=A0A267ML99_9FIRM|nr:PPC domain-containing DNA-binding protein [Anaeromicrobium sediminis]PAB59688.1 DNA-binding protein [Anaeromicrobium sediminis]